MEFFIPGWTKYMALLAALASAVVVVPPAYLYGSYKGAVAERVAIEGEIAKRTAAILKQRANDDAEIRNLDERALCLELLPDGVPDSSCD